MGAHCAPLRQKKNPLPFLYSLSSENFAVLFQRETGVKRVETAGVYPLIAAAQPPQFPTRRGYGAFLRLPNDNHRYCSAQTASFASSDFGTSSTRWFALPRNRSSMFFSAMINGPSTSKSSCPSSFFTNGSLSSSSCSNVYPEYAIRCLPLRFSSTAR